MEKKISKLKSYSPHTPLNPHYSSYSYTPYSPYSSKSKLRKVFVYFILAVLVASGIFFWQRELRNISNISNQEITNSQTKFYAEIKNGLEKSNKNAFELVVTGKKMLDKNFLEMAQIYFEVATQKDPDYRDAEFYLGYSYLKLAEISPDHLAKEAMKQYSNEAMDKSLQAFLKARDLDPLYGPTYEFLAYIYNKNGDAENARLAYEKAQEFKK